MDEIMITGIKSMVNKAFKECITKNIYKDNTEFMKNECIFKKYPILMKYEKHVSYNVLDSIIELIRIKYIIKNEHNSMTNNESHDKNK